jgi:crotonobetainyl-CoA:carnitine CoA-transferase CaiB-like acyl-CoA transferase
MAERPYEGVTVVSLEQAVAAPFATRQLADLGARVIKVERPGAGDFARGYDEAVNGLSSYFVWLNRSKESLTLDLKQPAGLEVLHELLVGADVFVQNLAPGAAARLGFDPASLAARYPRLIVCDVSGFGADGSWSDRKAYDLLVQAECGLVSITGSENELAKTAISIADIAAGMYAFAAIQTALYVRATTGRAPAVAVSLFEALAEWMGSPAYYTMYSGAAPDRVGAQHATIAPYGPYTSSDEVQLLVAVQNDREWTKFCAEILHDSELAVAPRFARNSDRVRNRTELNRLIAERFADLKSDELVDLLATTGIAYAHLNTVAEFLEHRVLRDRNRWRDVGTPAGPIRALIPPALIAGVDARMDPVPAVGADTDSILRSLNRTTEQIVELRALHVV